MSEQAKECCGAHGGEQAAAPLLVMMDIGLVPMAIGRTQCECGAGIVMRDRADLVELEMRGEIPSVQCVKCGRALVLRKAGRVEAAPVAASAPPPVRRHRRTKAAR